MLTFKQLINELNKKTLGSYIKQASTEAAVKSMRSTGKIYHPKDEGRDVGQADYMKSVKRLRGVARATDKLTKEEIEQIDETVCKSCKWDGRTKKSKLSHYKNGVCLVCGDKQKKKNVKEETVNEVKLPEADPKTPEGRKRLLHQYHRNENANRHTENAILLAKHFGTPEEHQKTLEAKKHRDTHGGYGGDEPLYKHCYNMQKKYYKKLFEETRIPIVEISKTLLGRYIKKAARSVANHAATSEYWATQGTMDDAKQALWNISACKNSIDREEKRHKGIAKATDKLTKEGVEQIDEAERCQHCNKPYEEHLKGKNDKRYCVTSYGKMMMKMYKPFKDAAVTGNPRDFAKEEVVNETLPDNATSSDYVDDFVHSKNKMFKGDSKKQRIRRALGAYYGKKNESLYEEKEHDWTKDDLTSVHHKKLYNFMDRYYGGGVPTFGKGAAVNRVAREINRRNKETKNIRYRTHPIRN